jgi:hypothetical protein
MDRIFEFEKTNPEVANLKVSGHYVWTVFRFRLKFLLLQKRLTNAPHGLRLKLSSVVRGVLDFARNIIQLIGSFSVIFRKYEYIIVSNNLEVRELDGKRVDKLAHQLISIVGEENTLVLCYGAAGKSEMHSYKNTVPASLIDWLSRFRWVQMGVRKEDQQILDKLQQTFGYNEVVLKDVKHILKKTKVLQWLLDIWKPKILFSCCYSNYAEIFAANQAGIDTVELQHGIIGPLHAGYEAKILLDKQFTSETLWTFGQNSTKGLSGNLVNLSFVWPIGNFYLQAIAERSLQKLDESITGKVAVCVPVDAYTEENILTFLVKVAPELPQVVFYVNPRVQLSPKAQLIIEGSQAFKVITGMPFQLLVRHCDIHTATDSTCCLEALTLGVQNILINDNGSAFRYYGHLVDPLYTKFADDPDAYIQYMNSYIPYSREAIIASNKDNYMADNLGRIREGLAKLGAC